MEESLHKEVTAEFSVDITEWSKIVRFKITFPLNKLKAQLKRLKYTRTRKSFTIVDHIDKTKYSELDNDLKFNVIICFKDTVSFLCSSIEEVFVEHIKVKYFTTERNIKVHPLALSYPRTFYMPKKWQEVPVTEYTENIFRRTLNQHADNGTLCIVTEIKIYNGSLTEDIKIDTSPNSLTHDLHNLMMDSTSSDVTVKSVEGAALPAHKLILSARSEVFKAHFEHGTRECSTDTIETMFETEVLQELLHYIYTDIVPNCNDMPMKLLAAADYYQLIRLKSFCEIAVLSKLTVDNAVECLMQADLCSANKLKESILEFINEGQNRSAVLKSDGWKNLQSVEIVKLVCERSNK